MEKDAEKPKHPGGRPTKYNPEIHLVIVQALAKRGLTLPQLAETLDVGAATVSRWMEADEEFREAIKKAREVADENVEASLYQRATGYSHKAVKIFMPAGAEKPVYAPYVEHVPPDPTSIIFWLKNRKPKEWRDKQDLSIETLDLTEGLTYEEKKKRLEEILASRTTNK